MTTPFFQPDPDLQSFADDILAQTWEQFPDLERNQLALTWLVYDNPIIVNTGGAISPDEFWQHSVRGYSYRGNEPSYPASIVKLFYLVAIQEWLANEMVSSSPELERAIHDMIVDSSNDATSLVVDVLSGTTSGPELTAGPFESWRFQRNIVNRYLQTFHWPEFDRINVNQKTWCDGPYGREQVFVGAQRENCNRLTAEAIARLMHSIIGGVAVCADRSQQMMALLKRSLDLAHLSGTDDDQITGFLGAGLPPSAQLWSKAGWTSQVRHDCAYIELPQRQPYLLCLLSEGLDPDQNRALFPFLSRAVTEAIALVTN